MTSKTCTRCGKLRPLTMFGINKVGKYGRNARCKPCAAQLQRIKYQKRKAGLASKDGGE